MANTKRNKSGYYERTLTVGHRINDAGNVVPVRKRFYGKTLKELNHKIDTYSDSQRLGIENGKQAFGVVAENWIRTFFIKDGSLKDSTKALYISSWQNTIKPLHLYSERLDSITARKLQQAYNESYESGTPLSTLRACHKLMRRFYKYVELEGFGRNITGSISLPSEKNNKINHDIVTWTDAELKTILSGFDLADDRFRLRFLIVLAYYTGMRKGELLALRYDDIEVTDDRIIIHVNGTLSESHVEMASDGTLTTKADVTSPKSSASIRVIPADSCIIPEFQLHRRWHREEMMRNGYRTNYVFTTETGHFYNRQNIDTALNRYYRRIGVTTEKSMHCYRHTYATNLCRSGVAIQTASNLLGHADISVTAKYYVNVDEAEKLAAAMTLSHVLEA